MVTKIRCANCDTQKSVWCESMCEFAIVTDDKGPVGDPVTIKKPVEVLQSDKWVLCIDTGGVFTSVNNLCATLNVEKSHIQNAIYGKYKAYGLMWRYIHSVSAVRNQNKAEATVKAIASYRTGSKSKEVICHQNQVIYKSATEAADKLKISHQNISAVANGRRKHTHGLTFEYTGN